MQPDKEGDWSLEVWISVGHWRVVWRELGNWIERIVEERVFDGLGVSTRFKDVKVGAFHDHGRRFERLCPVPVRQPQLFSFALPVEGHASSGVSSMLYENLL